MGTAKKPLNRAKKPQNKMTVEQRVQQALDSHVVFRKGRFQLVRPEDVKGKGKNGHGWGRRIGKGRPARRLKGEDWSGFTPLQRGVMRLLRRMLDNTHGSNRIYNRALSELSKTRRHITGKLKVDEVLARYAKIILERNRDFTTHEIRDLESKDPKISGRATIGGRLQGIVEKEGFALVVDEEESGGRIIPIEIVAKPGSITKTGGKELTMEDRQKAERVMEMVRSGELAYTGDSHIDATVRSLSKRGIIIITGNKETDRRVQESAERVMDDLRDIDIARQEMIELQKIMDAEERKISAYSAVKLESARAGAEKYINQSRREIAAAHSQISELHRKITRLNREIDDKAELALATLKTIENGKKNGK